MLSWLVDELASAGSNLLLLGTSVGVAKKAIVSWLWSGCPSLTQGVGHLGENWSIWGVGWIRCPEADLYGWLHAARVTSEESNRVTVACDDVTLPSAALLLSIITGHCGHQ